MKHVCTVANFPLVNDKKHKNKQTVVDPKILFHINLYKKELRIQNKALLLKVH